MELQTLRDAERYLDQLINREKKTQYDYERLALAPIRALLAAIGSPERGLPCIHVAGSKGKGTVTLATECLLRAAGLRVGTYTSPHLVSWRERFRIDGEQVAEAELVAQLRAMQPEIERLRADPDLCPSFFDVSTALALALFRKAGVDVGAIEVGLGGRLDSTNVVESRVSVVTTIQLEHTDKLGGTLELIAREKAGILRADVPALHGELDPEAWGAIAAQSIAVGAELEGVEVADLHSSASGLVFRLEDGRTVESRVLGAHQAVNLALAVRAAELFLQRELAAKELEALQTLQLPARLERFGDVILDSAHTPDSARALRATLETLWPGRRFALLLSVSRDKDAAGILAELAEVTRLCVATTVEPQRSIDPEELAALAWAAGIADVEVERDPVRALELARRRTGDDGGIVIAGSIFLAGALRPHLLARRGRF
jgi:dihydrofolate synthase/folylpolyglutamate synthase